MRFSLLGLALVTAVGVGACSDDKEPEAAPAPTIGAATGAGPTGVATGAPMPIVSASAPSVGECVPGTPPAKPALTGTFAVTYTAQELEERGDLSAEDVKEDTGSFTLRLKSDGSWRWDEDDGQGRFPYGAGFYTAHGGRAALVISEPKELIGIVQCLAYTRASDSVAFRVIAPDIPGFKAFWGHKPWREKS